MSNEVPPPEAIGLVRLWLALLSLWFAYYFVYRRARLEFYRQRVFLIRNRLWSYASERGLLRHPAHLELRLFLNGLLRVAPITDIAFLGWGSRSGLSDSPSLLDLIATLPSEHQREFLSANAAAQKALSRFVFRETLPGALIGLPVILIDTLLWWRVSPESVKEDLGGGELISQGIVATATGRRWRWGRFFSPLSQGALQCIRTLATERTPVFPSPLLERWRRRFVLLQRPL